MADRARRGEWERGTGFFGSGATGTGGARSAELRVWTEVWWPLAGSFVSFISFLSWGQCARAARAFTITRVFQVRRNGELEVAGAKQIGAEKVFQVRFKLFQVRGRTGGHGGGSRGVFTEGKGTKATAIEQEATE